MNFKLKVFIFFIFLGVFLYSQQEKLNQKEGIIQDNKEKHIKFAKIEEIKIDFKKTPIKRIKRVKLHDDKIFILESRNWEIYVIDEKGKYLYTIGRPGQGPGDLEYASDFFISPDNKVYVINSVPRRLEVFSIKGEPLGTIKIKSPDVFTYPQAILVNKNYIFLGSQLNHLISKCDLKGKYINAILMRKNPLTLPGNNLTFEPQISFIKDNQTILHFDCFKGVFTKLNQSGKVETVFSAFSDRQSKRINYIKKLFKEHNDRRRNSSSSFRIWSNFCVDESGIIYVIPYWEVDEYQKLFVFSSTGEFLYWKYLDYFKKCDISMIDCDKGDFLFVTKNIEIYKSNRR